MPIAPCGRDVRARIEPDRGKLPLHGSPRQLLSTMNRGSGILVLVPALVPMPLEKIRDLLKASLGRSLEALPDEDKLAMAWPVACGKAMAEHGTVAGFANGILRVQVADGPWRRQLMSMQSQLAAETGRIAGVKVTGIHWETKRNEPT